MKKILSVMLITVMVLTIACKNVLNDSNNKDKKKDEQTPTPPSKPENKPSTPETQPSTQNLEEKDILNLFGIQKGKITASATAKKIANSTVPSTSKIKFTERKIISYDDKTGELKMKFKGTIEGGASFDKTITFTQFTHPLKNKMIQSLEKLKLNFDAAIENNYSLNKYIKELNKNAKEHIKELSFQLTDSSTIELGEHENYTLKASAKASGNNIEIVPQIVYLKLAENSIETEEKFSDLSFHTLKTQLTQEYFAEKDVFKYILNKVDENNVIEVDSKEFASSFYAFAKQSDAAPDNIFSQTFKDFIKHYQDIYKEKDENKHLKLDISYSVFQPKNGGIVVDDYKGSLKINLCIATNQQITEQSNILATKIIEKEGFANIPNSEALATKKHLFFHIVEKTTPISQDVKTKWEQKEIQANYFLLRTNESNGTATVNNPFGTNSPFNLCVSGSDPEPSSHLGCTTFGASKTKNGKTIFIENIQLKKLANSKTMEVFVTLKGSSGSTLKITTEPNYQ
ncbi:MAG: hypothetical protein ACTTKH_01460 [Treponema sp.]